LLGSSTEYVLHGVFVDRVMRGAGQFDRFRQFALPRLLGEHPMDLKSLGAVQSKSRTPPGGSRGGLRCAPGRAKQGP
jgi:hypothetical protein